LKIGNKFALLKVGKMKITPKTRCTRPYFILLIPLLLILLGGIYFFYLKPNQLNQNLGKSEPSRGWGQRPGGAQDFGGPPSTAKKPRWTGPIPTPPKYKITYYKGLWGANWFYPEEYTGLKFDPQKYGKWGVNIVMLQPGFELNKNGEVRYPPDFPTHEDMDARMGELATKFYQANVHLGLTLIVTYKEEFSQGQQGEMWAGEPQPFPGDVVEKPGYFDQYKKVVANMAKIAQKYHIYMFSPMGEAEGTFGMTVAPSLIQEMVPIVRKNYSGKLYYKGDLHLGQGDQMNFKGYDVLGIVMSPFDHNTTTEEGIRKLFDANMDKALGWAKRDSITEVVVSEYGYFNQQMELAENFGIVLEEASKKLSGAFVSEPIPAVFKTSQGEQIIKEIQKWFLQ